MAKSTTALAWILRVLKTGKGVSACFISNGISVQPRTIPWAPFFSRSFIISRNLFFDSGL
jgi:hypothetical protein